LIRIAIRNAVFTAVTILVVCEKFMVMGNELSNYHYLLFTLFCVTISGGSMTEDIIMFDCNRLHQIFSDPTFGKLT